MALKYISFGAKKVSITQRRFGKIKSKDGTKILLITPDLASDLEGMVLDYSEKAQGKGFTISQSDLKE